MSSITAAKTSAIDWSRDTDNAGGWVGEYASAKQASDIAAALKADGYEVSHSDDSSEHEDNVARRWWVWVIVSETA